jgi:hypothetical protein
MYGILSVPLALSLQLVAVQIDHNNIIGCDFLQTQSRGLHINSVLSRQPRCEMPEAYVPVPFSSHDVAGQGKLCGKLLVQEIVLLVYYIKTLVETRDLASLNITVPRSR